MLAGNPLLTYLVDRTLPDLEVGELLEIVKSRHPEVDIFLMDSETGQAPRRPSGRVPRDTEQLPCAEMAESALRQRRLAGF